MPRKAKTLSRDKNKRFRITIELCDETIAILETALQRMQDREESASLSQLVRHAIKHANRFVAWEFFKPETLADVRRRAERRRIIDADQSKPS
jgi:DNA-directed RNA polymerase subunit F